MLVIGIYYYTAFHDYDQENWYSLSLVSLCFWDQWFLKNFL